MQKFNSLYVGLIGLALSVFGSSALAGNITMPAAGDTTDVYAAGGWALGLMAAVSIIHAVKRAFGR